jgi:hypothetical protein
LLVAETRPYGVRSVTRENDKEMLAFERIIVCLCVHLICVLCNENERIRDVWSYDVGVATVGDTKHHTREQRGPSSPAQAAATKSDKQKQDEGPQQTSILKTLNLNETIENYESEMCDFKGNSLKVAVSPQPPFVDCLQDMYGDWVCNGSNIELIHVLERLLNFKADWIVMANNHMDEEPAEVGRPWNKRPGTSIHHDDDDKPESFSNQAQMSAVIGLIATGRAMLGANGFMKTIDRSARSLIVSEPFDTFRLHLLLSKSVSDHDHIFIKPFRASAWLAILCSAALIVPIFYFINTTTYYYVLQVDEQLRKISLTDCWNHYKRIIMSNYSIPFIQARSASLTPSDLSFDKKINAMLMIEPKNGRLRSDSELALEASSLELSRMGSFRFALPLQPFAATEQSEATLSRRNWKLTKRHWAVERKRAKRLARQNARSGFFNVAYVIWYVVASLSNQGGETEDLPQADSTRILIAFWWLYLIVICAIHSGILTAILTFPKQHDFIADYMNLNPIELAGLHLSVDKHSELAHLLADSDNLHKSSLQLLKEYDVPVSHVNFRRNRQRILDSIQVGRTALIEEISTIKQIITREYYDSKRTKCLFTSSRYPLDVIPMSLVFSRRMPNSCVRMINTTLARVMQSGLARKWRLKFESPGNDCLNTVDINAGDVDKVELKHVILAFWLLAGGAGIGLVFLVAEIVWLFTIGDDEDDDGELSDTDSGSEVALSSYAVSLSSSSTSTNTLTSDESDRVRLGFRRALMPLESKLKAIRSFRAKHLHVGTLIRKTRRLQKRHIHEAQRRRSDLTPRIIFTVDIDRNTNDDDDQLEDRDRWAEDQIVLDENDGLKEVKEFYAKRMEEKRSKRSAREAERRAKRIQKTVQLVKRVHEGHIYSDRLKKRVRRLSHSFTGPFSLANQHKTNNGVGHHESGMDIIRRRRSGHLRIAPLS